MYCKVYIQVILHHRSCNVCGCMCGRGWEERRRTILVRALALWHDTFHKAPHPRASACLVFPNTQAGARCGKMSRHNRPASSWGKSEQEIQDISFALIALRKVGPTVKRPGCRMRAVSSREVSLLAVGGARVWRKGRERCRLKFEMKCKNPARARERQCPAGCWRRCCGTSTRR